MLSNVCEKNVGWENIVLMPKQKRHTVVLFSSCRNGGSMGSKAWAIGERVHYQCPGIGMAGCFSSLSEVLSLGDSIQRVSLPPSKSL